MSELTEREQALYFALDYLGVYRKEYDKITLTFEHVARERDDPRRWMQAVSDIFVCKESGRYWLYSWDCPLTENSGEPEKPDTLESIVEVERYEKTVVDYRIKK